MAAGMVKVAISIILEGKNFDLTWSPHPISVSPFPRSCILYQRRTIWGLCVHQITVKESKCYFDFSTLVKHTHIHAFEQKGTQQNLGSRQPILLFILTSDYGVASRSSTFLQIHFTLNN